MKHLSLALISACTILVLPVLASPIENSNLYDVAECCNLSAQNILTNKGQKFDNARQCARQSKQNCGEVQHTLNATGRF